MARLAWNVTSSNWIVHCCAFHTETASDVTQSLRTRVVSKASQTEALGFTLQLAALGTIF